MDFLIRESCTVILRLLYGMNITLTEGIIGHHQVVRCIPMHGVENISGSVIMEQMEKHVRVCRQLMEFGMHLMKIKTLFYRI